MQAFASLLDRLVTTPQRNTKLQLMRDYFRDTPDPDRGYAAAALTAELVIPSVKPAMLRDLAVERMDEVLFAYSYDYVGDLAETIALVWEARAGGPVLAPRVAALDEPSPDGAEPPHSNPPETSAAAGESDGADSAPSPRRGEGWGEGAPEPSSSRRRHRRKRRDENQLELALERPGLGRADAVRGAPGSGAEKDEPNLDGPEPPYPSPLPSGERGQVEDESEGEPTREPFDPGAMPWAAERVTAVGRAGVDEETGEVLPPTLGEVVETLQLASRSEGRRLCEHWLDLLDPTGRWGLIKLVAGELRVGVSARLTKQALADLGGKDVQEIEEVWHGMAPPYRELFAWLEGRGPKPTGKAPAPFRPVMLSHALDDAEVALITPDEYAAEWKWDGIRVQAVSENGERKLYSRTGDDISGAFPDLLGSLDFDGAIDGELLVGRKLTSGFEVASFGDLQQRLNRKAVSPKHMDQFPAFIRAYDLLAAGREDLRPLPFRERRARLERLVAASRSERLDISPLLAFADTEALIRLRAAPPEVLIEGLMLKRWDSVYTPGRPKEPWFKWKRDPHLIDAVLMYAQRGHGKRSSFYSDYTFGVWTEGEAGDELVPVGKAYFGFTDEELIELDRYVRNNTVARFGPVREVVHQPNKGLVFEVAFEGLARSTRHRSGVAMRFPRISRLRWDKPPGEADRLETLEKLIRE